MGWGNKMAVPTEGSYSRVYLILIDDRDRTVALPRDDNGRIIGGNDRQRAYESIYKLFSHHVHKCGSRRICVLRYGPGSTQQDINADLQRELGNKRRGDLVFVYFKGGPGHAGAGYEGLDYSLKIQGFPNDEVNVWPLIDIAAASRPDVTFLLDCYCPTRLSYSRKQDNNNVEVLAAPAPKQDLDGNTIAGPGNFHRVLDRTIKAVSDNDGRLKCRRKLRTINEFTVGDGQMHSNLLRLLWFGRTKYGDQEIVARTKIDPARSRQHGQAVFFQVRIQEEGDVVWPAPVHKLEAAAFERGRQSVHNGQPQHDGELDEEDEEDEGYAEDAGGHGGGEGFDEDIPLDEEDDNLFVSEDEADLDDEDDDA